MVWPCDKKQQKNSRAWLDGERWVGCLGVGLIWTGWGVVHVEGEGGSEMWAPVPWGREDEDGGDGACRHAISTPVPCCAVQVCLVWYFSHAAPKSWRRTVDGSIRVSQE